MKIKHVAQLLVGIILTLLGLLWFLQGADVIHLRPILCFADCEVLTGKSLQWQITGAVTFMIGVWIIGKSTSKLLNFYSSKAQVGEEGNRKSL
jgi:hypothetical protein